MDQLHKPALAFGLILLSTVVFAQQQKPPVFRTGIDLRQLDVTVLDKNRKPVLGLKAEDFTLTEDGVPQKVEAFSFVKVDDTVREEPVWASKTPSDIISNDLDGARVFAIVVDDIVGMGDRWAANKMPESIATFVNQLGPDDVASLIFHGHPERSINFTRDKARLAHGADWYPHVNDAFGGPCQQADTMLFVAENLATLKNKRKTIVLFGGGIIFNTSELYCKGIWADFVHVANENNITAYPVDTVGLRLRQGATDNYIALAHHVGGRALFNTNSFEEGLTRIFAENSSYYLLAYQPTNSLDNGRFRRVKVTVNRRDVEVVSSRNYWAPKAPDPRKPPPVPRTPEQEAMSGLLPMSQIPLRAVPAAFRSDDGKGAVVGLALGLDVPAFGSRTRESVDFLVRKFTPDGLDYGSEQQLITINVPAAPAGAETSPYEFLSRLDVPGPGRYEFRVVVHSAATDRRSSIYVPVEVPDFAKEKLSVSGLVIGALPGPPVGSPRVLAGVTPVAPTTLRSFYKSDLVTAFVRLYQGGSDRLAPVSLKVVIHDARGKAVFEKSEAVGAERFSTTRSADYQVRVPLATLSPGAHVLAIEATSGKITVRRNTIFHLKP